MCRSVAPTSLCLCRNVSTAWNLTELARMYPTTAPDLSAAIYRGRSCHQSACCRITRSRPPQWAEWLRRPSEKPHSRPAHFNQALDAWRSTNLTARASDDASFHPSALNPAPVRTLPSRWPHQQPNMPTDCKFSRAPLRHFGSTRALVANGLPALDAQHGPSPPPKTRRA